MSKNKNKSAPKKEILDPLIGLELTFSNAATKEDIRDDGFKSFKSAKRYDDFLECLRGEGFTFSDIVTETKKVDISKNLGDEKFGAQDLRISFVDKNNDESFWLNITRDPCVVEIQTMPIRVNILRDDNSLPSRVLDALFSQVFGEDGIAKYGAETLCASKEGGGHINLDAKTSGLDDLKRVIELIKKWNNVKRGEGELVEPESQTAANTKDRRYCRDNKKFSYSPEDRSHKLEQEIEKSLTSRNKTPKEILNSVSMAYWSYPQVKLFPHLISEGSTNCSDYELKICRHNQAINIEHLFDETESARRVEFREFRAQKSREEVLQCYRIIEEVLFKIQSIENNFSELLPRKSCEGARTSQLQSDNVIGESKVCSERFI